VTETDNWDKDEIRDRERVRRKQQFDVDRQLFCFCFFNHYRISITENDWNSLPSLTP